MVGEERGWLQRFIIWRERNIKAETVYPAP